MRDQSREIRCPGFRSAPSGLHNDRGLGPRWQSVRMDLHVAITQAYPVGREFLGERWRSAAVLQPVFVSMPRAGDAAVDDAAFADRAILMRADIRQRADLVAVAE